MLWENCHPCIHVLSKYSYFGLKVSVFFNTKQGGIQNSHRFLRHGNGFIEEWMSKNSLFIVVENTESVNIFQWKPSYRQCKLKNETLKKNIGLIRQRSMHNYQMITLQYVIAESFILTRIFLRYKIKCNILTVFQTRTFSLTAGKQIKAL